MTELKTPKLTKEERAHIAKGGRVFIVEEIPGPLWRVLAIKETACWVMLKPDGANGYSERDDAMLNAKVIANLSADRPLVREEIWTDK